MQWLKSHLTVVICGSLSLVSVVMLVLGAVLSDVVATMEADRSLANRLQGLSPVNDRIIDHVKQQQAEVDERLQDFFRTVEEVGAHTPLLPAVFREDSETSRKTAADFQEQYKAKQKDLLEMVLKAKGLPTPQDIAQEQMRMDSARDREQKEQTAGLPGGSGALRHQRTLRSTGGHSGSRAHTLTPEELAAEDATVRASIGRAHRIYCYAGQENLDQRDEITETAIPPSVEQMWYAQVSLWIQEDVIRALADLNNRAAEQLPADEEPWVGLLPVKHLVEFSLGNYLGPAESGSAAARRSDPRRSQDVGLPGDAHSTFTQRGSTATVDVIPFYLSLVVEAQRLLEVLEAISKAGFYTPLMVSYKPTEPNLELAGYIYGSAPTIKVDLVYEACFLRRQYEQWIPATVRADIEAGVAGGAGGPGGAGRPGGGRHAPIGRPHRPGPLMPGPRSERAS